MRKFKCKVWLVLLLAVSLCFGFPYSISATQTSGKVFTASDKYQASQVLPDTPLTFEAVIKVDENAYTSDGRLGVIIGNYNKGATHSASLEIRNNGVPFLYWSNISKQCNIFFDDVDISTGEVTQLAVVADIAAQKAYCYVNGELAQTKSVPFFDIELTEVMAVGGDLRAGNARYLQKAELYSVAVYSDMRSSTEILSDYNNTPDTSDTNLMSYYNLTAKGTNCLKDRSTYKNHLVYTGPNPPEEAEDDEEIGEIETEDLTQGVSFIATNYYSMKTVPDEMPNTIEASIYLPTDHTDRGGVIVGNYSGGDKGRMSLEIYTNGAVRMYYVVAEGHIKDYQFSNVDVRTGKWTHIAVVRDNANKKIHCYLDGVLAQSIDTSTTLFADYVPNTGYVVGGDLRSGNSQYFKGRIRSVTMYSDVRTQEEIAADMKAVSLEDENLIADYSFIGVGSDVTVYDNSSNGYDLKLYTDWYTSVEPLRDYSYSFAVVGDTQILSYFHPEKLSCIYDWLVANKESHKISYVFGMGDITNNNTQTEWTLVKNEIGKLDGVIPYSLVRGNHDGSEMFNNTFGGNSTYMNQVEGCYENSIDNTYRTFTVGSTDYLMLNIDYGASDAMLEWANSVVESYPNHNVIVSTHAYLYRDGTTLDDGDVCPPTVDGYENNGDDIWDEFVKKHENIVMVLCGHDPSANIVMSKAIGDNGNEVTQMLVDPQGYDYNNSPTGLVAMLYFSEDGTDVQVRYYSTVKQMYYRLNNQFDFTLDYHEPTYGDVNDDGEVDIRDLINLKSAMANNTVKHNSRTADCNRDGDLDTKDAVVLRKYLLNVLTSI